MQPEFNDMMRRAAQRAHRVYARRGLNNSVVAALSIPKKCCCSHPESFVDFPDEAVRRLVLALSRSAFYFARKFGPAQSAVLKPVLTRIYKQTGF